MTQKPSIVALTLQRDGISQPWGFRLSGGADTDHPLIVTKVFLGSPSDGVLHAGDLIKKISTYDGRDLNHKDALSLFKNAGSSIDVAVQRIIVVEQETPSKNSLSFIPQPPVAGGVATPFTVAGCRPKYENTNQPIRNNLSRFPPALIISDEYGSECEENTQDQPYRSTPLSLQGPKITKDPAPTMSYLRHHPNPMMRSKPAEYEWIPADISRKQQLADSMVDGAMPNDWRNSGKKVVTKQFNSPIGLYSDQNIANSVHTHIGGGMTPLKKTVVYDPSKSETFRVLQETEYGNHVPHEISPPTPRVFSPIKTPTKHLSPPNACSPNPNRASPQPHPTAPHPKIDYGVSPEEIHQSNSFKRLMHMVLADN